MQAKTKLNSTEYRKRLRALQDELSDEDRKWYLCRRSGRSYADLIATLAEYSGDFVAFHDHLGYTRLYRHTKYDDYGWWQTIASWMRMFIPQWEAFLRKTVAKLTDTNLALPAQLETLTVVADALGFAPEMLLSLAANLDTIEAFMVSNRRMLGVMAETKLWQLVQQGDPATIRWILPRLNTDAFGDKLAGTVERTPREIRIVESEI